VGWNDLAETTEPSILQEDVLNVIRAWRPSHIILDLVMPSESGMSVTQRLARAQVATPIILSSGADRRNVEAVARSARLRGLNVGGVLPKPFTRARLAEVLGHSHPPADDPVTEKPAYALIPNVDAAELKFAIKRGDIRPWLQPQVDCGTGEIVGFETLARWHHTKAGIVAPAAFIGLAESEGLIGRLTLAVANQALYWLGKAPERATATMSFNVTPSLLEEGDFVLKLLQACDRYDVNPARLVLEVTESTRLKPDVATLDRLTLLRLGGIKLSIDDFGIGYSSLLQLAHLPFSEIKIDRAFVSMATRSEESRAIVMSIISLAERLGMVSVAEGVEDKETLDFLIAAGCNRIQGYFFSRPVGLGDMKNIPAQYFI
jgi:EAL domain-containing protein (putative c-di-GMP-specific phosphodiesterase class I)